MMVFSPAAGVLSPLRIALALTVATALAAASWKLYSAGYERGELDARTELAEYKSQSAQRYNADLQSARAAERDAQEALSAAAARHLQIERKFATKNEAQLKTLSGALAQSAAARADCRISADLASLLNPPADAASAPASPSLPRLASP
jgi:hypothetical protein